MSDHGCSKEETGHAMDVKGASQVRSKCAHLGRRHRYGVKTVRIQRTLPVQGAESASMNGAIVGAQPPGIVKPAAGLETGPMVVTRHHRPQARGKRKLSAVTCEQMSTGSNRIVSQPFVLFTLSMAYFSAPPPAAPTCTGSRQCWTMKKLPSCTTPPAKNRKEMPGRAEISPSRWYSGF